MEKIQHPSIKMDRIALMFVFLLVFCNLHLLGFSMEWLLSLIFEIDSVKNGQYWRVVTHLFAHISWAHFLLDVSAFLLLWNMLPKNRGIRFLLFLFAAAGSLFTAWKFSPFIESAGLCGLSGVAHGLMVGVGIYLIANRKRAGQHKSDIVLGWIMAGIPIIKSILETSYAVQIFQSFYMGECGLVISHAHLGGIIGVIFAILLEFAWKSVCLYRSGFGLL